jgi:hypothetical protein
MRTHPVTGRKPRSSRNAPFLRASRPHGQGRGHERIAGRGSGRAQCGFADGACLAWLRDLVAVPTEPAFVLAQALAIIVDRKAGWTSVIVLAQTTGHPDAPTNALQGEARSWLPVRHCADVTGADVVPALRRHRDRHGLPEVQIIRGLERDMSGEERHQPVNWIPNSYAGCHQQGPDGHALAPPRHEGLGLMAGLRWDIGEGRTPARTRRQ